jgi:hypothetical protein
MGLVLELLYSPFRKIGSGGDSESNVREEFTTRTAINESEAPLLISMKEPAEGAMLVKFVWLRTISPPPLQLISTFEGFVLSLITFIFIKMIDPIPPIINIPVPDLMSYTRTTFCNVKSPVLMLKK